MKVVILPFLLIILAFGWSAPASAQGQVIESGPALSTEMNTQTGGLTTDYSNFHNRRIEYTENRTDMREKMDTRRENYQAPMQQALDNYKQAAEEHYAADKNKPVALTKDSSMMSSDSEFSDEMPPDQMK
ncbi:MAG: hypothetical protein DHS20C02_13070 [Micavibrio sp.]|nr:MAG: hypothetical protein DHS20C02_13070 [Micavibrio sp.]